MSLNPVQIEIPLSRARGSRPAAALAQTRRFLRDEPDNVSEFPQRERGRPAPPVDCGAVEHPEVPAPSPAVDPRFGVMDSPAVDSELRSRIVGELYKSYYHRVFCFARRFVHDEIAEEVAHEAFVRLLRVRNLERMQISVAYLLRIAENLLKRRHERAMRYRQILEQSGFVSGLLSDNCARESMEQPTGGNRVTADRSGFDSAELDDVLGQLTREEQAAVRLIVCEGLDYQSAARSLGVPVSTINNWKHRGLSRLKQLVVRPESGALRQPRAVG